MRYEDNNGNEVVRLGHEDRRQDIVDGLRKLADFIDANPQLTPTKVDVDTYLYGDHGDEFKELVRKLGSCEKRYDDWSFQPDPPSGRDRATTGN